MHTHAPLDRTGITSKRTNNKKKLTINLFTHFNIIFSSFGVDFYGASIYIWSILYVIKQITNFRWYRYHMFVYVTTQPFCTTQIIQIMFYLLFSHLFNLTGSRKITIEMSLWPFPFLSIHPHTYIVTACLTVSKQWSMTFIYITYIFCITRIVLALLWYCGWLENQFW